MTGARVFWGIDLKGTVSWISVIDLLISFPISILWIHSTLLQLYLQMHTPIDTTAKEDEASHQKAIFRVEIFMTVVFLMIHVMWLGFEVYLCILLRNGVAKKSFTSFYKWFNFRVALLMVGTYLTLLDIVFQKYNIADIVYEIKTVYRIFTMIIVKCFMNQMEEHADNARKSLVEATIQMMYL